MNCWEPQDEPRRRHWELIAIGAVVAGMIVAMVML